MKALNFIEMDVDEWLVDHDQPQSFLLYNFCSNGNNSFAATNATATASFDGLTLNTYTTTDPMLRTPSGLSLDGTVCRYICLDLERTAVRTSGAWQGAVFYTNAGHGESGSFFGVIPQLPNTLGARGIFVVDMWALGAGGDDWKNNVNTQVRFDFDDGTTTGGVKIRSISFGTRYRNRGAQFNNTYYLKKGAQLFNVSDSKQLTVAAWVYLEQQGTTEFFLSASSVLGAGQDRFQFGHFSVGQFFLVVNNAAGTEVWHFDGPPGMPLNEWIHVAFSMDSSDTDKIRMMINGEVVQIAAVIANLKDGLANFTAPDWAAGANTAGTFGMNGNIADLYLTDAYFDFNIEANRRKFVTFRKGPADLGERGELPTGTPAVVYLTGPADTWGWNKGRSGNFARTNGIPIDSIPVDETFRFAFPTDYLPDEFNAIPSIKSLSLTPLTVSLGKDLGMRGSLNVVFNDHPHVFKPGFDSLDGGTFWSKWRGRYLTTLRNRGARIIRGQVGQQLADMDTRHYLIDTTDGPNPSSMSYTMIAKDVLKLADDDRSAAPLLSPGSLLGSIDNVTTSASLSPAGIGNTSYPASGFLCLSGKEVVSYTRSGDALTMVRGQRGSAAQTHNAGDRAQIVIDYNGQSASDIIYDLLINYCDGIKASYITKSDWDLEVNTYLGVTYARTITEPTAVRKLLGEFVNQTAIALFWDDRAEKIRLKVLREISTDAATFTPDVIVENSLSTKENPDLRVSQQWTYFGQRDPTNQADDVDNMRNSLATVDLSKETQYGAQALSTTVGKWLPTLNAAERMNQITLSRYRDPPRTFAFNLFRDQLVQLAEGYRLMWPQEVDMFGSPKSAPVQITQIRVENDYLYIQAEEMLASGVIVLTHTVILITTGSLLSWTVPDSWNNAENSIAALGAGSGGMWGNTSNSGSGGAGGAYSAIFNQTLTPGASINYRVGARGIKGFLSGNINPTDGGDTWFGASTFGAALVAAKGAIAGISRIQPGTGGQASSGIGTLKHSGGDGGIGAPRSGAVQDAGGGGGGGAAGPNGDGADGGSGTSTAQNGGAGGGGADGGQPGGISSGTTGGNGGNNRFNFGGGTSSLPAGQQGGGGRGSDDRGTTLGGPGGDGEQIWTQTEAPIFSAGPGAGGGAGGTEVNGYDGGSYGGGGGGAGDNADGGNGAPGLIAITWKEA